MARKLCGSKLSHQRLSAAVSFAKLEPSLSRGLRKTAARAVWHIINLVPFFFFLPCVPLFPAHRPQIQFLVSDSVFAHPRSSGSLWGNVTHWFMILPGVSYAAFSNENVSSLLLLFSYGDSFIRNAHTQSPRFFSLLNPLPRNEEMKTDSEEPRSHDNQWDRARGRPVAEKNENSWEQQVQVERRCWVEMYHKYTEKNSAL